ncbi:TPA: hypothetical protein N0F65_011647 [Lagenidium giganteum]|uniref:NrS-1 polymerase-like helicase domain-containing protein n=1 Tax=Lagenidium giganteum TaxID=4803 RepID=A0AAV2ZDP9_9STRA|nr:TPA: hypothetical protein N0F65_011647 [Lagenidium giganteum]
MMMNIPKLMDDRDVVKYCLQNEQYDTRLFNLCSLLPKTWFQNPTNPWMLAGFDYKSAVKDFMYHYNKGEPFLGLSETRMKQIAGGTDPTAYNLWKAKYEPTQAKEKKDKKESSKFTTKRESCPPLFDCQNTETYLDVIKLKKSIVTIERIYRFIKGNIAYILQGGNGYYLTKNRDAFGEINYEVIKDIRNFDMGFSINNAIELDDDGLIEIDNTETETNIVGLRLMDVIGHYRDDITFGKIDFMPYNAKTGACNAKSSKFDWNSNEVFNKFNGFVHKYDPNFIVDQTKFKSFATLIQEVWGSGRADILEYNMKLFAWYVQRPYQKTGACVVLEGEEGCGKNIIFEMLSSHVIGKRYCLETPKIKLLTGRFNKARENKILTILNEAANVKQSSHEDQDEMKDVITEPTAMIEPKGIDPYRVKDCNNLMIASNNSYSVKASNRMRRFVYLLCKSDRIGDITHFKAILDEFNKSDGGIHLYHYLMSINLDGFHPQDDAPMTKEKSDLQKSAIDKPIKWLIECVVNGTDKNIFSDRQLEKTPDIPEFVPIRDLLKKYTEWMIEEAKDGSAYTEERFSKELSKFLGPNHRRSVQKIRLRGYDLSVNDLKEKIAKHTRRNDLFDDEAQKMY